MNQRNWFACYFSFGKIKGSAFAEWARQFLENQNEFKEKFKKEYNWKMHEYPEFFDAFEQLIGNY